MKFEKALAKRIVWLKPFSVDHFFIQLKLDAIELRKINPLNL